jgi:membrane-bound lytic murein transglycosylase D
MYPGVVRGSLFLDTLNIEAYNSPIFKNDIFFSKDISEEPSFCQNASFTATEDESGSSDGGENEREFVILTSYEDNDTARSHVLKKLALFTEKRRTTFTKWLRRSGKYIDLIQEILHEEGLPEDLIYLPLIESGYSTYARSRSNAVGPWQFISATAKRYIYTSSCKISEGSL